MTFAELMTALEDWLDEVLGGELEAFHPGLPDEKGPLPDVIAEVVTQRVTQDDPDTPIAQIEQAWVRLRDVRLSFMVDNSDYQAAEAKLGDYADKLVAAIAKDGTLGGRVPFVSKSVEFNNERPFIEYDDGTRGRETQMTITVGNLLEVE